jgi:uncharacterized caspase-like protein
MLVLQTMNTVRRKCLAGLRAALMGGLVVLHMGSAFAANRLALVIGNDAYRTVEPLQTARADASAMAKALEAVGFKVSLRLDVDDRGLKAAVRSFKSQLAPGDEAVFFYAGHGVQLGAENYLVPINVGLDDEEQIKDESVPLRRVLEDMQDMKPRFSLAIIDACRNNPFRSRLRSGAARGLIPAPAATGQMVIYSAGAGQAAIDRLGAQDRDPNGVFTRVLLREIKVPGVPVDRVVRKVRDQVVALARSVGHDQVPAIYDQTIGDFFFVPAAVVAAQTPAAQAPAAQAVTAPAPAVQAPALQTPATRPATVTAKAPVAAAAPAAPPAGPAGLETPQTPASAARAAVQASAQPRLITLENEQSNLTISRALTVLLEPLTPQEREWIDTFERNLNRLRYKSAFAIGPVAAGNRLQWGFGSGNELVRYSNDRALEGCGSGGAHEGCRIVYASGKLDGPAFVAAVRVGMGGDLAAYQSAWRRRLSQLETNRQLPLR